MMTAKRLTDVEQLHETFCPGSRFAGSVRQHDVPETYASWGLHQPHIPVAVQFWSFKIDEHESAVALHVSRPTARARKPSCICLRVSL